MCILGTSQIQDLDPSRVVCVLCSFSTLSLTHAPALYSYGLLASPGTDMPYPGSLPRMKGGRWDSRCSRLPRQWPLGQIELTECQSESSDNVPYHWSKVLNEMK